MYARMSTCLRSFVVLAALLSCACAASAPGPEGAPEPRQPSVTTDVVYGHKDGLALTFDVYRPAQPNGARIVLKLAAATSDAEFTRVTSIRELSDGRVLVADQADTRLVLLQWGTGEAVTVGREGAGPGEYRGVGWVFPLGGDSTLFTDSFLNRWNVLDGARFVSSISEREGRTRLLQTRLAGADERGHVLGVRGAVFSGRYRDRFTADSLVLLLAEMKSERIDTLARIRGQGSAGFHVSGNIIVGSNPLSAEDQALLFRDGWLALVRVEPYGIEWRSPDGRWSGMSRLPAPILKVTDTERCFAMARWFRKAPCDPSSLPGWPSYIPPFLPTRLGG